MKLQNEPKMIINRDHFILKIAETEAELVAAQKGAGMMIINASKFQMTDLVIMGIVLIGVIGYAIDILMRISENYLVPWKGK